MENYFAVFLPVPEGGYAVVFPDIAEAFTQGDTLAECVTMGAEVLAIAAEEYAKARKALPAPSNLDAIYAWIEEQRGDPDLAADGKPFIQLFQAPEVDMTPVRITISLAKSTLESLDAKARGAGLTRSGFISRATQAYGA